MEIEKAVEAADAIIVCLTKNSINKEGYVQRELRIVLDFADYKPEGTLYIIPVRLEECEPPRRLRAWQYADYFEGQRERALQRLLVSLERRADSLELKAESHTTKQEVKPIEQKNLITKKDKPFSDFQISTNQKYTEDGFLIEIIGGVEFVGVPAGKFLMGSDNNGPNEKPQHTVDIPYKYWIARFPITNELYNSYAKSKRILHPVSDWENKKTHPVVGVDRINAVEYCQWLNRFLANELMLGLTLRLPTEAEWEKAARGVDGREYPWGNEYNEKICNTREGKKKSTTPVGLYSPYDHSPYGCSDMAGNVWEWTSSLVREYPYDVNDGRESITNSGNYVLRGGSFTNAKDIARCSFRNEGRLSMSYGFRICLAPLLPE